MNRFVGKVGGSVLVVMIASMLIILIAVPAWCSGCTQCRNIQGIDVNERDGTVAVLPVVARAHVGQGAPGRCNPTNLPGNGNIRNLGTASSPNIKWGTSRITVNGSDVLMDGAIVPGWTWNSSTSTLTAEQGYTYVFDNSKGMLTSASGPSGLFVSTYTYSNSYPDRITQVTDSMGNVWRYGIDISKPGPSYVFNPDDSKKVFYTYKAAGTNGAGQYDRITICKLGDDDWVALSYTTYTYNSDGKIIQVSTTDVDDTQNPSITYIEYVNGSEGGRTNPVRRVYNPKLKIDMCYEYGTESITETYGGSKTYGYTQLRHRVTCSSATSYNASDNDDATDKVSRTYYYQNSNSNLDYVYKTVQMMCDENGDLQDYSTVKYQVYGYLNRFDLNPPAYSDVLRGKVWKTVDAMGNAKTYAYSTANGKITRIDLPTGDYTQVWYKQINSVDSAYIEKMRDPRGKFTRYTRSSTYPVEITSVEVSDDNSNWSTIEQISYYSSPSQKNGFPYQITVPDIEGTDDMVSTYDYSEIIGSKTWYRPSPTTQTYSWWNGSSYEDKSLTVSYYYGDLLRWRKNALNDETRYRWNYVDGLTYLQLPADPANTGTIDSNTTTVITDNSQTWQYGQLVGMNIVVSSGYSYQITNNTETTVTVYGSLANLAGRTYSINPCYEISYLPCCDTIDEIRNPCGNSTYYEYDNAGHIAAVRNDITGSSTYPLAACVFDDLDQLAEIKTYKDSTDSTGRSTNYTYDQLGRVTKIIYPDDDGAHLLWDEYYQYDMNDNLVAKLVGIVDESGNITAGNVTAYEYDSLDRLIKVKFNYSASTWPVSGIYISSEDERYQYDGGSFLNTQMVDGSGISSYTYDTLGRLVTYVPPLPANYEVDYTYNAAGEKTSVAIKENSANKYRTIYSYFKNGWLKETKGQTWVSNSWSDLTRTGFAYDAAGQCISRTNGTNSGDLYTEYTYNARGEVTSVKHWNSSKTTELYSIAYTRDGLGNPISVDFSGTDCPSVYKDKTVVYGYDAAGRLASATIGNGTSSIWSYDWVGNINPQSNTYNQADMLNKDEGYKYDYLGNPVYVPNNTDSNRTCYHYNQDNLLSQVDDVVDGVTTSTVLTWDGDGQRLELQRGSDTWKMIYDPTSDVPAVLLAKNYVSGSTTYMYDVREPDGELLCSFDASETPNNYYYHFDDLGSTVLVTDGSGDVTDAYAYDAYGSLAAHDEYTGSIDQPYQYVGQYGYYTHCQNSGLGLMQLGVRFYNPQVGRFTQMDPLGIGLNWYEYVNSNPLVYIDPYGLLEWNVGVQFGSDGSSFNGYVEDPASGTTVGGRYSGGNFFPSLDIVRTTPDWKFEIGYNNGKPIFNGTRLGTWPTLFDPIGMRVVITTPKSVIIEISPDGPKVTVPTSDGNTVTIPTKNDPVMRDCN